MINNIYSRTIWGLFLVAMNTFASLIKFIKQILHDLSVLIYIYTLYKEESTVYSINIQNSWHSILKKNMWVLMILVFLNVFWEYCIQENICPHIIFASLTYIFWGRF